MSKIPKHTSVDFSIVIPTFNRSEFLKYAILSVLRQQGVTFEIVICDDASTDGTYDIVHSFKDKRISYHRNPKRLGTSMNFLNCFKYSKGNYIFNLGDDDFILDHNTLSRVLREMKSNRSGMGKIGTITYDQSYLHPYQVSTLSKKLLKVIPQPNKNILIDTIQYGLGFYSGLIFNNKRIRKSLLSMDHTCFPDHMCHSYHKLAYDLILRNGIIYIPNEYVVSHLSVNLIPRYFNLAKHGRIYWEDPIKEARTLLPPRFFEEYKLAYTKSQLVMLPNIKYFTNYSNYLFTLQRICKLDRSMLLNPLFLFWGTAGLLPNFMIRMIRKLKIVASYFSVQETVQQIQYDQKIRKLSMYFDTFR